MIRWLLKRAHDHTDRVQNNIEERLASWIDLFKEQRRQHARELELVQAELELVREQMELVKQGHKVIQQWCTNVGMGMGVAGPAGDDETSYPSEPTEDPYADSSMAGLFNMNPEAWLEDDQEIIDDVMEEGS